MLELVRSGNYLASDSIVLEVVPHTLVRIKLR